ncbi:hypothetical protein EJ05DRAFT_512413 [Pseudovirgaria hyperparasitica]|uniref:Uncharacterized protein n=1 Tax=Pseudovirgaria hyperparasitica TaxID=470096 RepID=A0A6A6W450_9PEZI|nr:uncharacterized protein EJ05DRAFT_512413 [Pseudovirgaria hyperparasitica]KAF2755821.1 hypothetical protein EJ05DRAFT_512413 [Pseudovirgaria hyperparasitica]
MPITAPHLSFPTSSPSFLRKKWASLASSRHEQPAEKTPPRTRSISSMQRVFDSGIPVREKPPQSRFSPTQRAGTKTTASMEMESQSTNATPSESPSISPSTSTLRNQQQHATLTPSDTYADRQPDTDCHPDTDRPPFSNAIYNPSPLIYQAHHPSKECRASLPSPPSSPFPKHATPTSKGPSEIRATTVADGILTRPFGRAWGLVQGRSEQGTVRRKAVGTAPARLFATRRKSVVRRSVGVGVEVGPHHVDAGAAADDDDDDGYIVDKRDDEPERDHSGREASHTAKLDMDEQSSLAHLLAWLDFPPSTLSSTSLLPKPPSFATALSYFPFTTTATTASCLTSLDQRYRLERYTYLHMRKSELEELIDRALSAPTGANDDVVLGTERELEESEERRLEAEKGWVMVMREMQRIEAIGIV